MRINSSIPLGYLKVAIAFFLSTSGNYVVMAQQTSDPKNKIDTLSKTSKIDEVIIIGFGKQKRKDLTGAVDQIDAKVINNRPVANLGQALQGVIPNLNVSIGTGKPTSKPSLNIRGTTSLNVADKSSVNGSPYILVDGVPGDFDRINPEDVESVTVLKDAASATIYGARAAFGVVLITTKSGKKGKSRVDYSNSFQWSKPTAIPNVMNAYDLQQAVVNAYKFTIGNGQVQTNEVEKLKKIQQYIDDPVNNLPFYYPANSSTPIWIANINPYKEGLAKSAPMQKHNISISGGSDKSTYYASFGFQNQDGIYKINTDNLKRFNANVNLFSQVNNWFNVSFRTQYNNETYWEPYNPSGKGGWWTAMSQEPGRNVNMPIRLSDNIIDPKTGKNLSDLYTDNILSFMDYGASNRSNTDVLVMTVSPKVTLGKGWNMQADFSYKKYNSNNKAIIPTHNRLDANMTMTAVHTDPSSVYRSNSQSQQFTLNAYTDYNFKIAQDHNFVALLGFNQEWYKDMGLWGKVTNINPNIPVLGQGQGVQTTGDNESHWAVRGLFLRLTYDYKGKYLFQTNARYDGTSRFGTKKRFAYFPSFSLGWVISKEEFAKNWGAIDFLKLRMSYGSLGNQNVANYAYIPNYSSGSQLNYLFDGARPFYVSPPGLVDANLTWETSETIDFGADITLFKNWDLTFDWYKRRTSDILSTALQLPNLLGTSVPLINNGEIQTKGWDLSATYKNKTKGGLGYNFRFTLSDYRSEVTKFTGNDTKGIGNFYEGMNIGQIWGYETDGLYQSTDEIKNGPNQSELSKLWYPGDVRYKDLNGDGKINTGNNTVDNPGDRKIIGNSTPRFQYGFMAGIDYKGIDFSIFLQGVAKRDVWVGNNLFWGAGATGTYEVYNDSWMPDRTNAYYPLYYSDNKNRQVQTRYLQNGAYLRVKDVTLGYTLPKSVTEKIKANRIRIYGSAYNILDIKSVPKTFDPELLGMDYPIMKSFAFGIQVSF